MSTSTIQADIDGEYHLCRGCDGNGTVPTDELDYHGFTRFARCAECNGTGGWCRVTGRPMIDIGAYQYPGAEG